MDAEYHLNRARAGAFSGVVIFPMVRFPIVWLVLGVGILAGPGMRNGWAQAARPNVVWISVDDMRPVLGVLGNSRNELMNRLFPAQGERASVQARITPNLDRLAAQGVVFRQAHAAVPRCNPSRAAVMTGLSPARTGFFNKGSTPWRTSANRMIREAVTLPQLLRDGGYFTLGLGKVFHIEYQDKDPFGGVVNDWPDVAFSWSQWIERPIATAGGGATSALSPVKSFWLAYGVDAGVLADQPDWQNADFVATLLETGRADVVDSRGEGQRAVLPEAQPFFVACGLFRPHTPWRVPAEMLELLGPDEIGIGRQDFDREVADTKDLPLTAQRSIRVNQGRQGQLGSVYRAGKRVIGGKDGGPAAFREAVRHYLAAIAFTDRCVGRIIDGLLAGPYAENTIVVLWSDHGVHLGEKLHIGKTTLWEVSSRSTMVIADLRPGAVRGTIENAPVSLVDLYPTVAALAGVRPPRDIDGVDVSGVLRSRELPQDRAIFTAVGTGRYALLKDGYRYITYDKRGREAELYEIATDALERKNLLVEPGPRVRGIQAEMQAEIDRLTGRK